MAGIFDFLFGSKEQFKQLPTMSEEQQSLLKQLLGGLGGEGGALAGGLGNLQKLLSGDITPIETQARRQFSEQTVPGIAERFSGLGAGSQQSSAFGQQLGSAASSLEENLAAQKFGAQQQGMSQLMQLLGGGLGARSFETAYLPANQGFLAGLAPGFGQGIGQFGSSGLLSLLGLL